MCMKKFHAEKMFFWQPYRVFNLAIFLQLYLGNMVDSAYFVAYIPWSSDFALYFEDWCMNIIRWDYESVWHDIWPQNKCRSLRPIFHGPVI